MRALLGRTILCLAMTASATTARAQGGAPTVLRLAPHQQEQRIDGSIAGDRRVVYAFDAAAGMPVDIRLASKARQSLYHNVFAPSGTTLFTGSLEGERYQAMLPETGRYRIVVYLMRNDARRGKRADFTLAVRYGRGAGERPGPPFGGQPSFDCRKAVGTVERTVCSNAGLAELDARLAFVFRDALDGASRGRAGEIRAEQQRWLRQRDACGRQRDVAACLTRTYQARIGQLEPKR